ncbi:MAG: PAS domain S-box protein [Chloroflexi bacterium]|nr:PAS domain S-box protein [Chloroflexota bacterium]
MSDEVPSGVGPDLDRTALVVADRRGRIAYWSPGATDLFGYPAEAMVGRGVSILVPAAFRQRHTAGLRAAWATGVLEPSGAVMILSSAPTARPVAMRVTSSRSAIRTASSSPSAQPGALSTTATPPSDRSNETSRPSIAPSGRHDALWRHSGTLAQPRRGALVYV